MPEILHKVNSFQLVKLSPETYHLKPDIKLAFSELI